MSRTAWLSFAPTTTRLTLPQASASASPGLETPVFSVSSSKAPPGAPSSRKPARPHRAYLSSHLCTLRPPPVPLSGQLLVGSRHCFMATCPTGQAQGLGLPAHLLEETSPEQVGPSCLFVFAAAAFFFDLSAKSEPPCCRHPHPRCGGRSRVHGQAPSERLQPPEVRAGPPGHPSGAARGSLQEVCDGSWALRLWRP